MADSESHPDRVNAKSEELARESFSYPTNHLVSVVDTLEQLRSAVDALTSSGFLDSEVNVSAGEGVADALSATTGRTGWADIAMRLTERVGLPNDEMLMKRQYEEALRDGHYVLSVLALTDDRKDRAARIIADHGGHYINFLGRFSIQAMVP